MTKGQLGYAEKVCKRVNLFMEIIGGSDRGESFGGLGASSKR